MAAHTSDPRTPSPSDPKNAGTAPGRAGAKPSFAGTSIAADQEEQTATRRAEPRTTDETGEATTAAVPPKEPKEASGDLGRE